MYPCTLLQYHSKLLVSLFSQDKDKCLINIMRLVSRLERRESCLVKISEAAMVEQIMRKAQYLYKFDRKSHAQKIQNNFLLLGVKMQKISWAEPAHEPRQKLATLAFVLEISQYFYSRSTSGAGNLQLGTKILIAPYRQEIQNYNLKNGGTFSCYFSPHHVCPIGWPHVHHVKFRVA